MLPESRPTSPNVAEASGCTRRSFFESVGNGLYGAALASLLTNDLYAGATASATLHEESTASVPLDLRPRRPHFQPRAKSVIHLFMNGGPSQMDLFDPKPE